MTIFETNKKFNSKIAQKLGISDKRIKILMQFAIDKDGRIVNIKTRSKCKDLEKEACRVISLLPKMNPGKQRQMPIKVT